MLPLHIIGLGIILIGTIFLGINQRQRRGSKSIGSGQSDKHGTGRRNGDPAGELRGDGESDNGARSVGPKLAGKKKNVGLVVSKVGGATGNGPSDDSGGKQDAASRPDPGASINGDGEAKGGKPSQHQEGPGGKPSKGKKKKKGAAEKA